ncbi:hypothetical protein D3C77_448850 [compost metagenome]
MQVFNQLLRVAAQARDVRDLGIAQCSHRGIGLGHRQPPDRLLAVAHCRFNVIVTAHEGLIAAFDQHPFSDVAHELQLAFAVENHRFDRQCLQVQVVLTLLQFALLQLVVLTSGEQQRNGKRGEKAHNHRASGACAGDRQKASGLRRRRLLRHQDFPRAREP